MNKRSEFQFITNLLLACRKQCVRDNEVSDALNSCMPESVPSVFTTSLISDIVQEIEKLTNNDYFPWEIVLAEKDKEAKVLLKQFKKEFNE